MPGRGFYILDANGNTKLTQFGSGAALPDPVTVPHGGLGLTASAKGDIPYSPSAGAYARLAIDTAGIRVLTNTGSALLDTPAWADPLTLGAVPLPINRKWAFSEVQISGITELIWGASVLAGQTVVVDSVAAWDRFTTAAGAGSQAGIRSGADWVWLDHLPILETVIRTGSVLSNVRIFIFISNAAALPTNSDDQHALKGVGLRYSTVAADPGWMGWTADGTTQTLTVAQVANIAASTVYAIKISVTATNLVSFQINGGVVATLAIGAAALGSAVRFQICMTTTDAIAKIIDMTSVYGEWSAG